ncbi:MAG: efflux RND transporter periplasmic adaptor subunit [Chitinophagaceae bacterium]
MNKSFTQKFTNKIAAFFIFFLLVTFYSCSSKKSTENAKLVEYPVIELKEKDTTLNKEYVAQIQSVKNVEIRSQANGYIKKILVDEGQFVTEGQILFQLNAEKYQNEVSKSIALTGSAEAEMSAAEVEVRRVKILADKNVISKTELDLAEAKYKIAKAKVAEAKVNQTNAELHLSYAFIKAPFSGVLNRIPLKVGSLVSEGTLLTTITDVNTMFAYFNLSEKEYLDFIENKKNDIEHHADEVQLELANNKLFPLKGKIETTETEINSSTGSLAFRARFQNKDGLLKHGSSAKIFLTTPVNKVVLIPQKSVFEIQDKNYVYLLDKNNKVSIKSIVPSTRVGNAYLIKTELQAGDKILFEGNQTIAEGQIVQPKMVEWNGR